MKATIVYQVCRSDFEEGGGLGGGGYYNPPTPVKTFSTAAKARAYLKSQADAKEWRVKWTIQKLEVH